MTAPDVPPGDEVTGPWWDATRERRLLVQTCEACGAAQHPPGALCRHCGAVDGLSWAEAVGTGAVDACTVVLRSPSPALEAPCVVARVRLAEGPLLLTNVLADDPHAVAIGDRVALDWRPLPDGRALPVFVPDPGEEGWP